MQNVAQLELATGNSRTQGHADTKNVFAKRLDPAFVLIVDIGLETGVEHFADRLDHRIGHGDMQIATTAIQFDMEGGHHDHFTGADDVGQRRVHFRVDVIEVDIHYRVPGFLEVDKRLIQHHAHHAQLGGRKIAPLDFGVTTVAAKKVVHQFEHQFGVENKQAGTAQRLHLHQVEAGRNIQRVYVLAEFHHLHTAHRHVGGTTQQIEHTDAGVAGKTLVDHLKRWHAPTDNPVLAGQVILFDASRFGFVLGFNQAVINAMQQGIDFILGKQVLHSHIRLLITATRGW